MAITLIPVNRYGRNGFEPTEEGKKQCKMGLDDWSCIGSSGENQCIYCSGFGEDGENKYVLCTCPAKEKLTEDDFLIRMYESDGVADDISELFPFAERNDYNLYVFSTLLSKLLIQARGGCRYTLSESGERKAEKVYAERARQQRQKQMAKPTN